MPAFSDETSGLDGDVTYKLNVWHGPADGLTAAIAAGTAIQCPFTVTYETATPPPSVCKCADYCDNGCDDIEFASGDYNSTKSNRCVFFASATRLNLGRHDQKDMYINGKKFDNEVGEVCKDNASACESWLAANAPQREDGGYYIYLPGDYNYISVDISGFDPCAPVTNSPTITQCPVTNAKVALNGKVKITPTTTNCFLAGGCDYVITSDGTGDKKGTYYNGSITFTGESTTGTVPYTIAIRNTAGPAPKPCSFTITYVEDAAKEYVYTAVFDGSGITAWQTLTEGDAKINCSALSQGHLHCKNGESIKIGASTWNSPYDYNSLTDCHGTTLNATITGSIQCAVYRDW